MRYLLDSHVVIWAVGNSLQLSDKVRAILAAPANLYISIASLWEIAIKCNMGKLELPKDFDARLAKSDVHILPIGMEHIRMLATLDNWHRDPFDRMIIAQAKYEHLTLITDDKMLAKYDIRVIAV
jgi:PIN domain nuclease of toxin-antitoxin system